MCRFHTDPLLWYVAWLPLQGAAPTEMGHLLWLMNLLNANKWHPQSIVMLGVVYYLGVDEFKIIHTHRYNTMLLS